MFSDNAKVSVSDNEEANVLNSEEILECTDQPTTNISLKDIPNELIMGRRRRR